MSLLQDMHQLSYGKHVSHRTTAGRWYVIYLRAHAPDMQEAGGWGITTLGGSATQGSFVHSEETRPHVLDSICRSSGMQVIDCFSGLIEEVVTQYSGSCGHRKGALRSGTSALLRGWLPPCVWGIVTLVNQAPAAVATE